MNDKKEKDINEKKQKKEKYNQLIDDKKGQLKKLYNLEYKKILISKGIDQCINLLKQSANGEFFNKKMDIICDENLINLRNSLNDFENQKQAIKKDIKKTQDEMDNL